MIMSTNNELKELIREATLKAGGIYLYSNQQGMYSSLLLRHKTPVITKAQQAVMGTVYILSFTNHPRLSE